MNAVGGGEGMACDLGAAFGAERGAWVGAGEFDRVRFAGDDGDVRSETVVLTPCDGIVDRVLVDPGAQVTAGEALAGAAELAEAAA